jgi:hypothetical protein
MDGALSAGLSRREFLVATGAASLLLYLDACTFGQSSAATSIPLPPGSSPYEQALKLLHQAVLASPDHLVQRAAEVVATKDATKIVDFVRDRIAVAPAQFEGRDPTQNRRWGSAATMRAGLGTLRERADVLADLLTQAGFKADIYMADRPAGITVESLYRVRTAHAFAPDKSRIDLAARVLRQAGLPAPPAQQPFNGGPDPSASILSALPAPAQVARVRADLLPQKVPVVVFKDGGKTRYAFATGDIGVVDSPPANLNPRQGEDDLLNVIVTVSAVCSPGIGSVTPRQQMIDLVTASWPADQVFGHHVLLTFVPLQGPKAILDSGLANLPLRVPVLHLQNDTVALDQRPKLAVAGSLITVHGDVLGPAAATASPNGDMAGAFGTMKVLSDTDRKAAVDRAKSIRGTASATSFPDVYLEFAVDDASGAAIDGLDAPSFSVKEGGKAVDSFVLYSNANAQPRPRVLIIYEGLPGPNPFKTEADQQAFAASLAGAIVSQAARTPFDVQVIRPGHEPDPGQWAAPDKASLVAAFQGISDADDPWRSIGGTALDQRISAVIEVGDADVADPNSPHTLYYQRRVVEGRVPVFFMPVGGVKTANVQEIVSLSGGAQFDIGDPATPGKVASLAGAAAGKWIGGGYRIRYPAPVDGPAQRTVTLGLAGHDQPVATMTYQVPAQPIPPPSFAGLYVTVQFGDLYAQRRIAGAMLKSDPFEGISVNPNAVAETRAALDGVTTIAVEPGTPTPAALLDDLISSYLSAAPLVPIWNTATNDQLLKALPNGLKRTPVLLPSLLRQTKTDAACVPGMRLAIFQERAPTAGAVEVHCDLAIGLNEIIPLAGDRHAAFKAAVVTSVAQCAAEAATLSDSAYKRLEGVPLTAVASGDYAGLNTWMKTVPAEKLAAWIEIARVYDGYHLLLPAGGGVDALWVVDPRTGVAKAAMLDSTGGGFLMAECKLDGFAQEALTIAFLALFCSSGGEFFFPLWCVGINVVATLYCVIALFNGHADVGTPFGAIQPWVGLGRAGLEAVDISVGVMLILITLSDAGCI